MARVSENFSAFTAGELSPRLRGRTDLKLYKRGCKTLENMYVLPQGGATKRPGTYYISDAYDYDNEVRLIPFVYSETDSYVLEFGENYIRFFKDSGIVLDEPTSAGLPYILTTPYNGDDLTELKFVQTADVMYIAHPSYPIRKLSRYDHNDWTFEEVDFYGGPFFDQNIYEYARLTANDLKGKDVNIIVDNGVINSTFTSDLASWDVYENGGGTVTQSSGRARITGDDSLYSGLEQEFDIHPDYSSHRVTLDVYNSDVIFYLSTQSGVLSGDIYQEVLSTGSNTIDVSISASRVYLGFSKKSSTYGEVDNITLKPNMFSDENIDSIWSLIGNRVTEEDISGANSFTDSIVIDAGESFVLNISGTWSATVTLQRSFDQGTTWVDYYTTTSNVSLEFTEASDNVYYRVGVKSGDYTSGTANIYLAEINQTGWFKIKSINSARSIQVDVLEELPGTDDTFKWAEGAWGELNGYPSAIAFFEQRLLAGGTPTRPQTIWGSQVDDYENFQYGIEDDEAYQFSLVSTEVNTILWMLDKAYLLCGTLGGEWKFGFSDQPTTPTTVDAKRQTTYGSHNIEPVTMGHNVIYTQRGGTKLRTLFWDYTIEGYKSPEISQMSEHLLKDGIKEISSVNKPDPLILMVTDAGDIICCTFDPDIQVIAYSKWTTDGEFESITSIPGTDRDEIWVVVKRNINGTDYRYIEQFQTTDWTVIEDGFFIDSGLTYSGTATQSVSGLSHLEGETVVTMGDGAALASKVVSAGTISFNSSYEKMHVGLQYTSKLETMDLEVGAQAGSSQGKLKKPYDVTVYLLDSVGLNVGFDEDNLDVVPFRTSGVPMGQAVPLFTGDKRVTFNKGFGRNQSVIVTNGQPLPFTVISIVTTIYTSDL